MRAFDDLPDPLGRLEEVEIIASGHALCLEQIAREIRNHGEMFVQVSDSLVQMSTAFETLQKQNVSLQKQAQALHHRLKVLETKEIKND
jgi:chaperonin cofactor prefoldin